MAKVRLEGDTIYVDLSLVDQLLGFHGSFRVPLAHVVNAYVSTLEDLELLNALEGTNWGFYKSVGLFGNRDGLIFVDASGGSDCLVMDLRGEQIPRLAVELPPDDDPNAIAHEIMRRLPDSGPVE